MYYFSFMDIIVRFPHSLAILRGEFVSYVENWKDEVNQPKYLPLRNREFG